jgi:hypothetical protein
MYRQGIQGWCQSGAGMFTAPLRMEDLMMIYENDAEARDLLNQVEELLAPVTIRGHVFQVEPWVVLPTRYHLLVDGKHVGLFGISVEDALTRFRRVLEINREVVVPMDRVIAVCPGRSAPWQFSTLGVAGPQGETIGYRKRAGEWFNAQPNEVYARFAGLPVGPAALDVYFTSQGRWLITRPATDLVASRIGGYDGFLDLTTIPLDEREEIYEAVSEQREEVYADVGFSHVCGGGSVGDAMIIASQVAGSVSREEFGLPPIAAYTGEYVGGYVGGPSLTDIAPAPTADDDIPF